jgi:hypothetical protein
MADLFFHLPFARRLRHADGLHPLAGEALGRRPALVVFGACMACLPESERRGMSWFRRLFSGGGEAARWQKLLAPVPGQPHVSTIVSLLSADDAAVGPLARLALGIGMLSHELVEQHLSAALGTASGGPQRAAVERAQARLWLQSAVPTHLENEWKPVLELAGSVEGADAQKRAVLHVDRALKRVHGSGPGEAALARWLKGLVAEIGPLADGRGASGALPASLSVSDHEARGPFFDQVSFVEKAQAAVAAIVGVANKLGEVFTMSGNPDRASIQEALTLVGAAPGHADIEAARVRWKQWLTAAKESAIIRGRNTKPAFIEGEAILPEHKLGSLTGVMRLSDLPPEAQDAGAPPVPEGSGPVVTNKTAPPIPPSQTQEVSLAQIEAEARAAGFQTPAHTQEVSLAQIEAESLPPHLVPTAPPPPDATPLGNEGKITQPISAADVAAANAVDEASKKAAEAAPPSAAPAAEITVPPVPPVQAVPPVPPATDPPRSADEAAVSAHVHEHANGANGHDASVEPSSGQAPDAKPADAPVSADDAAAKPPAVAAEEPTRE